MTFIARDGYLFAEYSDRQEYANSFELTWEFELIEENVDIDDIEELNDTCYDEYIMTDEDIEFYHNATRTKINETIQALKQLNERLKKLEE